MRDWENEFAEKPTRSTLKVGLWVLGVCAVLALVIIPLSFVLGWLGKAAEVAGPENVSTQYATVIEDWNAMQAAAGNYCSAKNSKTDENSPTLVEDPAFAYAAQYRHITVDYNRRMNNIFEGGVVGPSGYPKTAPSLEEAAREAGC